MANTRIIPSASSLAYDPGGPVDWQLVESTAMNCRLPLKVRACCLEFIGVDKCAEDKSLRDGEITIGHPWVTAYFSSDLWAEAVAANWWLK